jgi:hypothetical protein
MSMLTKIELGLVRMPYLILRSAQTKLREMKPVEPHAH